MPLLRFWALHVQPYGNGRPFFTIILLAGIQSIPDEIEETMGAPGTSSHIGATSLVTMLPLMLIFLVLEKYNVYIIMNDYQNFIDIISLIDIYV